jgi:hypothetical protein
MSSAYQKIGVLLLVTWLSITLAQSIIAVKDGDKPDQGATYAAGIAGLIGASAVIAYLVWAMYRRRQGIPAQLLGGGGDFSGLSAGSFY